MTEREASPSGRAGGGRVLAVVNQKGGVGKTTTAINLGTALAASGRPTLVCDLDPQGNASTGLGVAAEERTVTTYDLLTDGASIDEVCRSTIVPGLSLAPASVDLSGVDIELMESAARAHRLNDSLRPRGAASRPLRENDYLLIDCPPSLNLLTINAMVAADAVLVPLQCEFFALEGLSQLMETIRRVKRNLNPRLEIEGVVLTMHDRRNNLSGQVAADVRSYLGDLVFDTVVPRNVRLSEAPSHAMPALIYDHSCAGSQAYIALASELLRRGEEQAAVARGRSG